MWHFCGARNSDKLELLNNQILRVIFNDSGSPYDVLLKKMNMKSLKTRRLQDIIITVFKCLNNMAPSYLSSRFKIRNNSYNLRGVRKLWVPKVITTTFRLHSFTYLGVKLWNSLRDEDRALGAISSFKTKVRKLNLT